eukprot:COSAG02_NODE_265_length_26599_cov_13.943698_15_plen_760_part_00
MELLPDIQVPGFLGGGSFQLQRPLKCDQSCMSDLQLKLFVVFTGKTYGMKILELGVPLLRRTHTAFLQVEDDAEQQPLADSAKSGTRTNDGERVLDDGRSEWKGVDQEFAQMVTQFGYLALFAPACSLAPLLAFINNVTEIRSDAWKICNLFQRPIAKQVQSIGAWADVLKMLALSAVIVNSTMVFFVGSQMACPHDNSYVKQTMELKESNVDEYEGLENADRPTFAERRLDGLLCYSWSSPSSSARKSRFGDMLELDGVAYRVTVSRLWVLALILEHFVLMLRFSMGSFLPTVPKWLETARETLTFKKIVIEGGSDSTLQESIAATLKMVRRMGADHPEEVFDMMDEDNDGKLTPNEIGRCCKYMGMRISDQEELMEIVNLIDGDGDTLVDKNEFSAWWVENGGKNKYQLKDSKAVFKKYDGDGSGSLEASELVKVCHDLGMHKLSAHQEELLMQELDADGNNQVDADEFDMWWQDSGGEKFRPRAPPGPGDMSRKRRFDLRRLENEKRAAEDKRSEDYARLSSRRGGLVSTLATESGVAAQVEKVAAEAAEAAVTTAADGAAHANGGTVEVEHQHGSNDRGWAALRTGHQHHALFDGQNDASHMARRAAAMLKPMPLRVDHAKMTRHELRKAQHGAMLDRRVERLLMGSGAEISHQAGGQLSSNAAAAATPPIAAPRPWAADQGLRAAGQELRAAGMVQRLAKRSPPSLSGMAASVGVAAAIGNTWASSATPERRRPPPMANTAASTDVVTGARFRP